MAIKFSTRRNSRRRQRSRNTNTSPTKDPKLKELLGIKEKYKIPKTILRKVKDSNIGSIVKLPTKKGRTYVKVTKRLKKKAVAVWNTHYAS